MCSFHGLGLIIFSMGILRIELAFIQENLMGLHSVKQRLLQTLIDCKISCCMMIQYYIDKTKYNKKRIKLMFLDVLLMETLVLFSSPSIQLFVTSLKKGTTLGE